MIDDQEKCAHHDPVSPIPKLLKTLMMNWKKKTKKNTMKLNELSSLLNQKRTEEGIENNLTFITACIIVVYIPERLVGGSKPADEGERRKDEEVDGWSDKCTSPISAHK